MATYFIDLDGVFFEYGTMNPTPGAVKTVNQLSYNGSQVYFTTLRKEHNNPPHLNISNTRNVLEQLHVAYDGIITGSTNPRYLINDESAYAINHPRNQPIRNLTLRKNRFNTSVVKKVYAALAAIAWVSWKYEYSGDADDYIQTIIIAKSLISNHGFNHLDLVKRYREKPTYIIKGMTTAPGGAYDKYHGQISKLLQSQNPRYQARGGVSDGSAMKVLPISAYYIYDLPEMIRTVDNITRITHGSVEARLAAVLIALRFRQILLTDHEHNPDDLVHTMEYAQKILRIGKEGEFFLRYTRIGANLAKKYSDPNILLYTLAREIGINHLAWSTPISACFWSFRATNNYRDWFVSKGETDIFLNNKIINFQTTKKSVIRNYEKQLHKIHLWNDFITSHGYHWRKSIDTDTFFSIGLSLTAAKLGIDTINNEINTAQGIFHDDLNKIACALVYQSDHLWLSVLMNNYGQHVLYTSSRIKMYLFSFYDKFRLHLGIKRGIKKIFGKP